MLAPTILMQLNKIFRKAIFITLPIILVILAGNVNAKSLNNVDFVTYEITAPDGNTYKVEAPQDTTRDQATKYVTSKYPLSQYAPGDYIPMKHRGLKNTSLSPPAIMTLALAILFTFYVFFSKLDVSQKIRLLIISSAAWSTYVYFFITYTINDKFFINTIPIWLFWSFYFIRGKSDLSFKFSVTDYASTMFDHDVYVSGKRNFIHVLLGFLTSYFVLFFLPKDGILKVLPIIIIAITAWLVAVLPLNIAKEKKIIVNNKQQNIWLIYCLLAWPIALIHSIVGKKIIQPENNEDKKCDYELFHGGDGLSKNSPVSINCASMEVAKSSMDIFIKDNCGDDCKRANLEYTIANPNDNEKLIKVIPVTKPDGTTMEFFFDLSRQVNNFTNMVKMFGDNDK